MSNDVMKMLVNVSLFNGNYTINLEELVNEVISNRRQRFFERLFSFKEGIVYNAKTFDAITFQAVTGEFYQSADTVNEKNFEGEILYDVIAGNQWCWYCKTK